MNKYAQFYAILTKLKAQGLASSKEQLVSDYTEGRTESLKAMNEHEYAIFVHRLKSTLKSNKKADWQNTPENIMRRKIIAILQHQMKYTWDDMEEWLETYGKYKKKLQKHTKSELPHLVTQVEKYYQSHLKSL